MVDFTIIAEELRSYMRENHPEFCFFGFGSCFDKERINPPNDIDGGIIAPELITDKKEVLFISKKLAHLISEYNIEKYQVQINLLDRISSRNGRFLSYSQDYTEFIRQKGVVLSGPDFRAYLADMDNKFSVLESAAFNFRTIRNDFLFSYNSLEIKSLKEFLKAIRILEVMPRRLRQIRILAENSQDKYKKIAELASKEDKYTSAEELKKDIEFDMEFFKRLPILKEKLIKGFEIQKEMLQNWAKVLETFETIVKGYIERYPVKTIRVNTLV